MIRFVCTCGHRFEVEDDLAGVSIQCPKCHLLVDVPTLQELESFTDEGTYRLDADKGLPQDDPDRLADLDIIYSKDKVDEQVALRALDRHAAQVVLDLKAVSTSANEADHAA